MALLFLEGRKTNVLDSFICDCETGHIEIWAYERITKSRAGTQMAWIRDDTSQEEFPQKPKVFIYLISALKWFVNNFVLNEFGLSNLPETWIMLVGGKYCICWRRETKLYLQQGKDLDMYLCTLAVLHSMHPRVDRCVSVPHRCDSRCHRWSHTWSPLQSHGCRCICRVGWGAARGNAFLRECHHTGNLLSVKATAEEIYSMSQMVRPTKSIWEGQHKHFSVSDTVHVNVNEVTRQWAQRSEIPHTAAESSPGPASAGEAADGAPPQQFVPSIAAYLTAGSQRALIGSAPRGAAGHLPIGQSRRVTPMWVWIQSIDSVSVIWSNNSKLLYSTQSTVSDTI